MKPSDYDGQNILISADLSRMDTEDQSNQMKNEVDQEFFPKIWFYGGILLYNHWSCLDNLRVLIIDVQRKRGMLGIINWKVGS